MKKANQKNLIKFRSKRHVVHACESAIISPGEAEDNSALNQLYQHDKGQNSADPSLTEA
jgi:hypothetical protein